MFHRETSDLLRSRATVWLPSRRRPAAHHHGGSAALGVPQRRDHQLARNRAAHRRSWPRTFESNVLTSVMSEWTSDEPEIIAAASIAGAQYNELNQHSALHDCALFCTNIHVPRLWTITGVVNN